MVGFFGGVWGDGNLNNFMIDEWGFFFHSLRALISFFNQFWGMPCYAGDYWGLLK